MAVIAEAPGHRAERHRCADGHVFRRAHEAEETVGLDVVDQTELVIILVGQRTADLNAAGMNQHVDPAMLVTNFVDDGRQGRAIEQIHAAVMGLAARRFHRFDGAQGCFISLHDHQLLVDLGRGHLLAGGLGRGDQMLLERVLALPEQGDLLVVARRFGHEVEQIE